MMGKEAESTMCDSFNPHVESFTYLASTLVQGSNCWFIIQCLIQQDTIWILLGKVSRVVLDFPPFGAHPAALHISRVAWHETIRVLNQTISWNTGTLLFLFSVCMFIVSYDVYCVPSRQTAKLIYLTWFCNLFQQLGVVFKLRVVEGLPEKCYLPYDVEHPLYMPTIDK